MTIYDRIDRDDRWRGLLYRRMNGEKLSKAELRWFRREDKEQTRRFRNKVIFLALLIAATVGTIGAIWPAPGY